VIASQIRRVADPPVLLLHAMVVYLSFLLAAWIADGALPIDRWALWRLAIPSGAVLLGMILAEAYAKASAASRFQHLRAPLFGAGLALVSRIRVPFRIVLYGAAVSLILASTTNLLFPPSPSALTAQTSRRSDSSTQRSLVPSDGSSRHWRCSYCY
jgi:hypothetical protein